MNKRLKNQPIVDIVSIGKMSLRTNEKNTNYIIVKRNIRLDRQQNTNRKLQI